MKVCKKLPAMIATLAGIIFHPFAYAQEADQKEPVEPPKITIIHAGQLLAIPGDAPLKAHSVIVEDKNIIEIRPGYVDADGFGKPVDDIIDLTDKFVMPGLIDAHTHIVSTRGEGKSESEIMASGVADARKTLMAGFTTARDLGGVDSIFTLREAINAGEIDGPRIYTAGQIIHPGGSGDGQCNSAETCRQTTRSLIRRGADWIKIYASCGGGQHCANEDGPATLFDDEFDAIVQVARKYDIKVAAHAHTLEAALFAMKHGVDSIEHGTALNAKAFKIMKEKGVYMVPTVAVLDVIEEMVAGDTTSMPPDVLAQQHKYINGHGPRAFAAYKAGVKMGVGSDIGMFPAGRNFRELERLAAAGIPTSDVLKIATISNAALLDISKDVGTLEQGKQADIIALGGSPIADMKNIENVVFVMREGRVYKDGRIQQ